MSARPDAGAMILVVDDEASIVRLYVRTLATAGHHNVHGLTDATDVPAFLASNTPDLVILDLNMPGLDGFALLREIAQGLSEDVFLPVMAVSGMSTADARERAFRSGAKDFLAKPIDLQEFLLHVESLLETRFLSLRLQQTQERLAELVGLRTEELQQSVARTQEAEEALHLSEAQFQILAESAGVGVGYLALDSTVLFLNDAGATQLGRKADELIGKRLDEELDPALGQVLSSRIQSVAASGETLQFEDELVSAGGKGGWSLSTLTRVVDAEGAIRGVQIVSTDISARRLAEESLLLTQFCVDNAAEAILWLGCDGNVQYANEYCSHLYGYSSEELRTMGVGDLDPDLTEELWRKQWDTLKSRGSLNFSARPRKKSGERFQAEVTATYLRRGDQEQSITFARDITDRQLAEDALRVSEQRLAQMVESMSSGVVVYEPSGNGSGFLVKELNKSAEATLRVERGACVGLPVAELFPGVREIGLYDVFERVAATGLAESLGASHYQDDRLALWVENYVYKLPSGEIVAMFDDVTEKHNALAELRKAYSHLREAQAGTLQALGAVTEFRDPYTAGHQQRVGRIAVAIGRKMGLPRRQLEGLLAAATVHDIGKIAVPIEILTSPAILNPVQQLMVRQHVESGYEILKAITFDWPLADVVAQHHERLDGSGYPKGLKGNEISLEARILAVADTAEAMISHRPYRPALGVEAALSELRTNAGLLYDSAAVDALVHMDVAEIGELAEGGIDPLESWEGQE